MKTPGDKEFSVNFALEKDASPRASPPAATQRYEFHVSRKTREEYGLEGAPFSTAGSVVFADYGQARAFAARINERNDAKNHPERAITAGTINAIALIEEILHAICSLYRESVEAAAFDIALEAARDSLGPAPTKISLVSFAREFPPSAVYSGGESPDSWLGGLSDGVGKEPVALEELLLLRLENENPALTRYRFLFDNRPLKAEAPIDPLLDATEATLRSLKPFGPGGEDLITMLRAPMLASPHSLAGQLDYMRRKWGMMLGDRLSRLLGGLDMLDEEERLRFPPGPGPTQVFTYEGLDHEYERFSLDKDWMPRVVMIAKSSLVWLDQLSRTYGREIRTLDAIPEAELDILASRGFNALWLIGVWERSHASRRIKELCGNPEAAASAYSLFDYEIALELGGWPALETLRRKAEARGIRLAADMVPNHTGLDSAWVRDRPDLFIRRNTPPFPSYSFNGENLSGDGRYGLWLEDHYYDRHDAAVVFKRVDFWTGETVYLYHGNDGTSMPWNDTAQIDFLNPTAREAVKERILHVARNFPIIRFDAAMVLAKRSIRRLWYPEPGSGGAIASRFESAMPTEVFNARIPEEFWREVVDMCASEAPETLLLAEAFWMMEGYFVRTLGMHRVYNSSFMNMLKEKKNAEYRQTIRNTLEFDKDILKRFVNFMNNPDEEPAVAQFGSGDHYFGVCSMMATMPGLPMFGHGQVEGFTEKYGMEYRRAYKDESPDELFIRRHEREIFPLLKRRYLFSGVDEFLLYDLVRPDGSVDENVFAYSNGYGDQRALVLYNNGWERSRGTVLRSCSYAEKRADGSRPLADKSLAEGLRLRGGPLRFAILFETRRGLRYLRRSDDLIRSGLGVMLEGFQCQVFLDIYEVEDDAFGSYTALHDALGGSGVPNVADALEDLRYGELYRAWSAAFGFDFWKLAVTHLEETMPGAQAVQDPLPGAFVPPVTIESLTSLAFVAAPLADIADSLPPVQIGRMRAADMMQTSLKVIKSAVSLLPGSRLAPRPGVPETPAETLARRVEAVPGAPEALAAFAALVPFASLVHTAGNPTKARLLADSWGMARKLGEALAGAGVDRAIADRSARFALAAMALVSAILRHAGPGGVASITPRMIAEAIASNDEVRSLLGVNVWEGTTWFNADAYALASVLAAAVSVATGAVMPKVALTALDRIDKAARESRWSLELFGGPLSEPPASPPVPKNKKP